MTGAPKEAEWLLETCFDTKVLGIILLKTEEEENIKYRNIRSTVILARIVDSRLTVQYLVFLLASLPLLLHEKIRKQWASSHNLLVSK